MHEAGVAQVSLEWRVECLYMKDTDISPALPLL